MDVEKDVKSDESGQATVEYVLLMAMVVGIFLALQAFFQQTQLGEKLKTALFDKYSASYRYGHPDARANPDSTGQFQKQARFNNGRNDTENFRIFVNPSKRQ